MVEREGKGRYQVYILKNEGGWLYVGHTGDLMERVKRHNNGEVRSTRNRGPFHLIYSEEFNTRSEAMRRERYLKTAEGGLEKRRIIKEIGA